jgi:hypothetical protein
MMTKKIIKIVLVVGVMFGLMIAGYFLLKYRQNVKDVNLEAQKTVEQVSKIIILPDENPTVATVTDIGKLAGQKFFEKAQNGDRVLIFTNAKEVILYRPMINKIVALGPVESGQSVSTSTNAELSQTSAQLVSGQMQLVLDNGTQTVGLTTRFEKKITSKFPDVVIKSKEMAVRNDYQQTIIIDISGKYQQTVNDLANFLGAKIVPLPEGETSPEADALIIFGKSSVQ